MPVHDCARSRSPRQPRCLLVTRVCIAPAAGADEISRICRTLSSSGRVAAAAGGGGVLVLPLHGGLPPSQQARVFNRPPKGASAAWGGEGTGQRWDEVPSLKNDQNRSCCLYASPAPHRDRCRLVRQGELVPPPAAPPPLPRRHRQDCGGDQRGRDIHHHRRRDRCVADPWQRSEDEGEGACWCCARTGGEGWRRFASKHCRAPLCETTGCFRPQMHDPLPHPLPSTPAAVIDTGRVKEMRFDAARGIARLQETFVSQARAGRRLRPGPCTHQSRRCASCSCVTLPSAPGRAHSCFECPVCSAPRPPPPPPPRPTPPAQASAQQRRGRAGRVRPGVCYRLFSQRTWGKMPRDTPPEIKRAPLQVRGRLASSRRVLGAPR